MSVMVPSQLKFIEGKTYSVLLEVDGSSPFLEEGPYKLIVALGTNP